MEGHGRPWFLSLLTVSESELPLTIGDCGLSFADIDSDFFAKSKVGHHTILLSEADCHAGCLLLLLFDVRGKDVSSMH